MKFSQRCLSLLLCFALLSVAFSVPAFAEDIETQDFKVTLTHDFVNNWGTNSETLILYPHNDEQEASVYTYQNGLIQNTYAVSQNQSLIVEYLSGESILKKGRPSTVTLHNAYTCMLLMNPTSNYSLYDRELTSIRVLIHYTNGTFEYIDNVTIDKPNNMGFYNFTVNFTPSKDVHKIEYLMHNELRVSTAFGTHSIVQCYAGEQTGNHTGLSISIQSEEAGLLASIIEWLRGIKDGITNVFQSIGELPGKIWTAIENGFYRLFVPSQEFMVNFIDSMKQQATEKFGALYQVTEIIIDSALQIREYDRIDKISIPEARISLGNNKYFSFGPYEVNVIPNHRTFTSLVATCKAVTSIVCTVMFLNGLRKRYDEVMEANE